MKFDAVIYFLFDKDVIVYIGKSKLSNISNRINRHVKDKEFDRWEIVYSNLSSKKAIELESNLISQHKPKYNKNSICDKNLNFPDLNFDAVHLKQIVSGHSTARAFVDAFNTAAGFEALDETVLNNQMAGRRGLSKAWRAAYTIFSRNYNSF